MSTGCDAGQCVCSLGVTDRRAAQTVWAVHIPVGAELGSVRLHHPIQSGVQFQTSALFVFGIFHTVTETPEREPQLRGGLLYTGISIVVLICISLSNDVKHFLLVGYSCVVFGEMSKSFPHF